MNTQKHVAILGTRGIPACHGGFETFAERFALYLVEHGWKVTVYCQKEGRSSIAERKWNGVNLVDVYVSGDTPLHTIFYDYKCVKHATKQDAFILNLGYNTGFLNAFFRFSGHHTTINMDGLEWKRDKWPWPVKVWFYLNEILTCKLGNELIADHPEIARHLSTRVSKKKITTIAYGADDIGETQLTEADDAFIETLNLKRNSYFVVIARPVSENSIYEIVAGFSQKHRGKKLVVLGAFDFEGCSYHKRISAVASDEVVFPGAIYEQGFVAALRYYSLGYIHGHRVGGTNPSLVESLGTGSAVIAHDNAFNRWVTNNEMLYFSTIDECSNTIQELIDNQQLREEMSIASKDRFKTEFTWDKVLSEYLFHFERLLVSQPEVLLTNNEEELLPNPNAER